MDYKFCLPVIENSKLAVLNTIDKYSHDYSYLEIWLDYIEDLDPDFIEELISSYDSKLLFLFRRKNLEATKLNSTERIEIINLISGSGCYLDLDINNQLEDLKYIQSESISLNLITSFHNYSETPSYEQLSETLRQMQPFTPEIFKFSCFCNKETDAIRLLNFLFEVKSLNKKFVVLGMGEKALVTRIFASFWGNEMIFAPPSLDKASAPGQIPIDDFKKILSRLS